MTKRTVTMSLLVLLILLGVIGYDLAQIQAGLEAPTAEVSESAMVEARARLEAEPISSYASFNVPVEGEISVVVHMQEAPEAIGNILMVHGAGGGAWVWETYFELLPQNYNLYALSWRGHFTSTPVEDANSADYVQDQLAVMDAIAKRNSLPIHVIGHSYGGAISVLATGQALDQVTSLHLLAPVVPLNYSFIQAQLVPLIMSPILRNQTVSELAAAEETIAAGVDSEGTGMFAGMFLDTVQMERYWDLYAGKPYSVEKPSLIAVDGLSPNWQTSLDDSYQRIGESDIPVWFLIARYDNVVVPGRQRAMAVAIGAELIEVESGHYIPLDMKADEAAAIIEANLD